MAQRAGETGAPYSFPTATVSFIKRCSDSMRVGIMWNSSHHPCDSVDYVSYSKILQYEAGNREASPQKPQPLGSRATRSLGSFHLDPLLVIVFIKLSDRRKDENSTSLSYLYNCCFMVQYIKKFSKKANIRYNNKDQEMYLHMQMRHKAKFCSLDSTMHIHNTCIIMYY